MAELLKNVTVEVKAKLTVDKQTADTCLKLVEMFINENGMDIIGNRLENGEVELHYEPTH